MGWEDNKQAQANSFRHVRFRVFLWTSWLPPQNVRTNQSCFQCSMRRLVFYTNRRVIFTFEPTEQWEEKEEKKREKKRRKNVAMPHLEPSCYNSSFSICNLCRGTYQVYTTTRGDNLLSGQKLLFCNLWVQVDT